MGNKGFCANLLLFRVKIRYHKAMDIFCRIVKISSAKYLCLFCLIFLSVEALAARWAVVGVSRAKIYSDVKMTKVIGYVGKGKKVRVGEKAKNNGLLLPMLLKNRVVYIEVSSLSEQTDKEKQSLKTVAKRYLDKINQKKEIRRVGVYTGLFYGLLFRNDFSDELGQNLIFTSFGLRGYYRSLEEFKGYRITTEYMSAEKDEAQLSIPLLEFSFLLKQVSYDKYKFDLYFGPLMTPYVEYVQGEDFKITGQALGAIVSAELKRKLKENYTLHLDASYQALTFYNMELPANGLYPKEFEPILNGFKLSASITYSY